MNFIYILNHFLNRLYTCELLSLLQYKEICLVLRIPCADPSQTVILGAHIDSPNSPGAFGNVSGAAALTWGLAGLD
jgi:hypothetical protein